MMIDELDFSGGDATPAILQDYGRVKLVGVNTAGAGGTVEQFSSKGMFPVSYSLTTSLMVRPGGRLVENYGVKPDIEFELTAEDVADGFSSSFERMLDKLGI
jgi:C-terminal processing protease CtpA/Prc